MLRIQSPLNYLKQAPMDIIDSRIELLGSLLATKHKPNSQSYFCITLPFQTKMLINIKC